MVHGSIKPGRKKPMLFSKLGIYGWKEIWITGDMEYEKDGDPEEPKGPSQRDSNSRGKLK